MVFESQGGHWHSYGFFIRTRSKTERQEATGMKRVDNIKREYIQNHNDEGEIDVIQMIWSGRKRAERNQ